MQNKSMIEENLKIMLFVNRFDEKVKFNYSMRKSKMSLLETPASSFSENEKYFLFLLCEERF